MFFDNIFQFFQNLAVFLGIIKYFVKKITQFVTVPF